MASLAFLRRYTRGVGIFRSPPVYNSAGRFRSVNSTAPNQRSTSNKAISPWGSRPRLMQPPAVDEVVGCSHGWVALFNNRNNHLFLSDPLSHREVKLPPVDTLPDPEFNLDLDGRGSVSKLILSSSPDDDDCRAMMTYGPANRLAFCLPGRSSEWTPIGDPFFDLDPGFPYIYTSFPKVHEDLVYCSRRNVFTSITAGEMDFDCWRLEHFEYTTLRCDWDIEDPDCPKLVRSEELCIYDSKNGDNDWIDENMELLKNECIQILHLAYSEEHDQVAVVIQFVRLMKEAGGPPLGFVPRCELKGLRGEYPGNTFGFVVLEVHDDDDDEENIGLVSRGEPDYRRKCFLLGSHLSGRTMFVGINHSFAFDAIAEEEFKPNSIYFTDSKRLKKVCGANDIGIFDYATKTLSSNHHFHVSPTPSFKASSPYWFV